MKYTRYDMKKRNSSSLVLGLVLVSAIIFAFLIGTVFSNMFLKEDNDQVENLKSQEVPAVPSVSASVKKNTKYIAVQGGMFEKAENADRNKSSLSAYGSPFTIQEQKGVRVFLGIYNEEEGQKIINMLSEKSIESSKMVFEINSANDPCSEEIAAMVSAELEILSKLNDKNIKSFQTEDLKKWTATLTEVDKNSKNISVLNEMKAHINNLPKEIVKEKVPEYYTFIYNLMKKMNVK